MAGVPKTFAGYISNAKIETPRDGDLLLYQHSIDDYGYMDYWYNIQPSAIPSGAISIDVNFDKSVDGATLSTTSIQGKGTSLAPLYFQWPFQLPGDIMYYGGDLLGLQVLSTGGSFNQGELMTVASSGLPSWQKRTSELYNGYVFPDASHQSVNLPNNSSWTAMNGTNGTKSYPYQTGGVITADTLTFIAPSSGSYRLTASFQVTGSSWTGQFAAGFDMNGSADPYNGSCIQVSISNTVYFGEVTWERPFQVGDQAKFYMLNQSGSVGNVNAITNWMSVVAN